MRVAGAVALLYAARRYYRNWGTTKEECQLWLPGDELVRRPAVQTTEGVWIDAPPKAIWPWLVQMGQDRGGLYSYERGGESDRAAPSQRRPDPSGMAAA